MLPLSLGRLSATPAARKEPRETPVWFRPANIAAGRSTEVRALITWLAVFVALGVVIALGHVWLRLKVVDFGYRLLTTRQLIEKLQQEGHELAVEAATLDAPGRLEDVARTRLGMTRPEKGQEAILP